MPLSLWLCVFAPSVDKKKFGGVENLKGSDNDMYGTRTAATQGRTASIFRGEKTSPMHHHHTDMPPHSRQVFLPTTLKSRMAETCLNALSFCRRCLSFHLS